MLGWLRKVHKEVAAIPDRILLARIKRGDREAYGQLYMKYIDQIYRYVYFRLNQNQAEAEDITEAVFFKAYRQIKKYHINGISLQSWFYTIARNALTDYYRSHTLHTPLDDSIPDIAPTNIEKMEKVSELESLKSALNRLSYEQREVITLKYIEGESYTHIAQVLEKSEDAVRQVASRAVKELRRELSR